MVWEEKSVVQEVLEYGARPKHFEEFLQRAEEGVHKQEGVFAFL